MLIFKNWLGVEIFGFVLINFLKPLANTLALIQSHPVYHNNLCWIQWQCVCVAVHFRVFGVTVRAVCSWSFLHYWIGPLWEKALTPLLDPSILRYLPFYLFFSSVPQSSNEITSWFLLYRKMNQWGGKNQTSEPLCVCVIYFTKDEPGNAPER